MNDHKQTPIVRLMHIDNLEILLNREGLHAPNCTPNDGLPYHTIHNTEIQEKRSRLPIECGPKGNMHDYIAFYFGHRSPMLYQLHTGQVSGYTAGQECLIYLVSCAEDIAQGGLGFVFSDGHGIAKYTKWYDDLSCLGQLDWPVIQARVWKDTDEDNDRQRRKQAEFLVYHFCAWKMVNGVVVLNARIKEKVEGIFKNYPNHLYKWVKIKRDWYY